jgi:MFS family permease
MGGFGRLQKISWIMNTLSQGAAAFFLQSFVFLEKHPVYECRTYNKTSRQYLWEKCDRSDFCKSKVVWRVNWKDSESIHNFIEQFNFYCQPDFFIGLIGAIFLLGIVVGCSTLTRLGDVYGRKPIYLLGMIMNLGFTFFTLGTNSILLMYFMMFVLGLSVTARYYVGYTYNLEM